MQFTTILVIQSVHMYQLWQLAELNTYPPLYMVFTIVANTTRTPTRVEDVEPQIDEQIFCWNLWAIFWVPT